MTRQRNPALDSLRACAVLGVVAFHYQGGLPGGFLGVDLFFVLSGFVITRLLLREHAATGRIRLGRFWLRRAKRLLPALLAVLIGVQLWLADGQYPALRTTTDGQTLAALAEVANWYAIHGQVDYWSVGRDAAPLAHLWSLSVEEQFYLLWPPLLVLLLLLPGGRRVDPLFRRPWVSTGFCVAGACVSYVLAAALFDPSAPDRSYLGTDTRSGALLLGAAVALAPRRLPRKAVPVLGTAAALVLAGVWGVARLGQAALPHWQLPLAGLAAALLIAALDRPTPLHRALLRGPMRALPALGRVSYSLYLWHWPVWVLLSLARPGLPLAVRGAVAFVVSLGLAVVMYRAVEKPLRYTVLRPPVLLSWLAVASLSLAAYTLVTAPVVVQRESGGPIVSGPG
ncbi:acyltransferase [Streptomyces sp. NBC_00237]|uniref:acyltransferase family protein n=1 Tax=Streptomyces sp. NBC_00237 TaxID=2975687 RepID=UPI0022526342|nr:acyltransferase [Streptomyces sp. NBC_00237]MCX5203277.1 acyltransferase [Streptomyces sp. NBC_00237]